MSLLLLVPRPGPDLGPSTAASNSTPFVQGLWESGALLNPLFAFGLNQLDSISVPDVTAVVPGGILTIGDVNTTLFTGSINYTPLSDAWSYWSIPLQNFAVGDKMLGLTNNAAVIDTYVLFFRLESFILTASGSEVGRMGLLYLSTLPRPSTVPSRGA